MYIRYFHQNPLPAAMVVLACVLTFSSCMKLTQAPPASTELQTITVFSSDTGAEAAIAGLFSAMMTRPRYLFNGSLALYTGLSGDELHINVQPADPREWAFARDTLSSGSILCENLYSAAFTYVNDANAILQGLSATTRVSTPVKNWVQGEAEFARALSYFYLVNLYGDVPYITGTDYAVNEAAGRTPSAKLYGMIIGDLINAQGLLSDQYMDSLSFPGGRIYPNRGAATALLARVYLYTHDWLDAEVQASNVINDNGLYQLESDVRQVFGPASREAIWQLEPVSKSIPLYLNTGEASIFLPGSRPRPVYSLDSSLLQAFEPNDKRLAWVGTENNLGITYTYPYKDTVSQGGKPYSEYNVVLRLAEQYLIRAEARARQNDSSGAASDLNIIRVRAGLGPTTATDIDSLIAAIYQERRIEFFAEWGHRWFDLKRSGQLGVVKAIDPARNLADTLYPIPFTELQLNPHMTQNPGY
jgi:hypothetical protein